MALSLKTFDYCKASCGEWDISLFLSNARLLQGEWDVSGCLFAVELYLEAGGLMTSECCISSDGRWDCLRASAGGEALEGIRDCLGASERSKA